MSDGLFLIYKKYIADTNPIENIAMIDSLLPKLVYCASPQAPWVWQQ